MPVHLPAAALAKAKALGIVAAALAAGSVGGIVALSTVGSSSTTTVVSSSDSTAPPATDPTGAATPTPTATESGPAQAAAAPTASAYALPSCPADVHNHGGYVSSVAHDAPKGDDGAHGKAVSAAAHSDCGKPATSSEPTESPRSPKPKPAHTSAPKAHSTPAGADARTGAESVAVATPESSATTGKGHSGHGGH